jgi:hypothetical protein
MPINPKATAALTLLPVRPRLVVDPWLGCCTVSARAIAGVMVSFRRLPASS